MLKATLLIADRSVRRTLRQPAAVFSAVFFPLMLFAMNASGLYSASHIPGFPNVSYVDFSIAGMFLQGTLFAGITAGTELAGDIENGFLRRFSLMPIHRTAVLVGELAGAVAVTLLASILYVAAAYVAGGSIRTGFGGIIVIIGLVLFVALAFGSIGLVMALQTGSGEAVQGMFPLLFVLFLLSSVYLPRELIEIDWFRTVATWNPVSYLIEGVRSLIITGWQTKELLRCLAISGGIVAVMFLIANRKLHSQLSGK